MGTDLIGDIIAFENGELEDQEVVDLFQKLIDNGQAWTMQGMYGRTATILIDRGLCHVKGENYESVDN